MTGLFGDWSAQCVGMALRARLLPPRDTYLHQVLATSFPGFEPEKLRRARSLREWDEALLPVPCIGFRLEV